jgi:hypothetical protein
MDPTTLLALALIEVHTLDGKTLYINENEIIALAPPHKELTDKAECVITMTDKRFQTVKETCAQLLSRLKVRVDTGNSGK